MRTLVNPARVLVVAGVALLPWTLVLARTLPSSYEARHWAVAWVGLDLAMAAGALGTAALHRAGDRRAVPLAAATATVALADVWFDVTTSAPGWSLAQALVCGVVELAFAACCAAVALDDPGLRADEPAPAEIVPAPVSRPLARRP